MKQRKRECILPFSALLILIVVLLIETVEIVSPSQRNNFEIISNVFMMVVAVAGLCFLGLPDYALSGEKARIVLSNVGVSGIALCMNIAVFKHTIMLNRLLDSLWGWPLVWLVLAAIQMLLLSGLGEKLLDQICAFRIWCKNNTGLVRKISSELLVTIKHNRNLCWIAFGGFILWGAYIGIRIYLVGVEAVFTGTDIFEKSVWFWVTYNVIWILLYGLSESLMKIRATIQSLDGKKILIVLAGMTLLVIVSMIPSLLKIFVLILLIPVVSMSLLWFGVRIMSGSNINKGKNNSKLKYAPNVNLSDLAVVVISFNIPLACVCFMAWLQIHGGESIVAESADTGFNYLDFLNAAGDVAQKLLESFI